MTKVSIKGQLNKFSKIEKLLVSFLFAFVLGIRANGFVFLAPLLIFYIYINQKNETLFRDTTCKSEDNEGKVFYRVGKSLRGGDGAFLDQTKFVSGEGRWKLLEGKSCLLAYSTISGDSIEGYLTSKMICEIPMNIFNRIKNYKND